MRLPAGPVLVVDLARLPAGLARRALVRVVGTPAAPRVPAGRGFHLPLGLKRGISAEERVLLLNGELS